MRTVRDILETKENATNVVGADTLVFDALRKLIDVNLSYVIVMDGNEFLGVFCERDYTRNVILQGRSSKESKVKDVMTTNLPVVPLTKTVEECMYLMNKRGTRYLAVYDGDNFAGIVTIHDLLREVLANKELVFDDALTTSLLDTDEGGKFF
jgi:CBS domain-containing protein